MGGKRGKYQLNSDSLSDAISFMLNSKSKKINVSKVAKKFEVPYSTLSDHWEAAKNKKEIKKTGRQPIFSKEEQKLFLDHIITCADFNQAMDLTDIRFIAKFYLDKMGKTEKRYKI